MISQVSWFAWIAVLEKFWKQMCGVVLTIQTTPPFQNLFKNCLKMFLNTFLVFRARNSFRKWYISAKINVSEPETQPNRISATSCIQKPRSKFLKPSFENLKSQNGSWGLWNYLRSKEKAFLHPELFLSVSTPSESSPSGQFTFWCASISFWL